MAKKLGQCVALDVNGRRCRRQAVSVEQYHGDHELYDYNGNQPTWVCAAFCEKHKREPRKRRGEGVGR